MSASAQVMFSVVVCGGATGYAFYLEIRRSARSARFLEWLKTERTTEWAALGRADRLFPVRAVEMLRRGPLADDAEFNARYRPTKHGKRFAVTMTVASTAIALLLIGTSLLNWRW